MNKTNPTLSKYSVDIPRDHRNPLLATNFILEKTNQNMFQSLELSPNMDPTIDVIKENLEEYLKLV